MFASHFYSISAVIITLGLVKVSLSCSGFSPLVTISLGCTLSYCFFENGLAFFPFASYFFRDQVESFFLFLKKSFTTLKESFSFTGNQTKEKDGGAGQIASDNARIEGERQRLVSISEGKNPSNDQVQVAWQSGLDKGKIEGERQQMVSILIPEGKKLHQGEGGTSSTFERRLSSPGSPLWSHLEKGIMEKDWHSQLGNLGLALGVLLAISRSCVGLLGKLAYTKRWVEKMVSKGFPKFLFFWIPDSNQESVSERSLFNLLLSIFVLNFVIVYFLFKTL